MQMPIFLRYFISTFLNLKHSQNITTVKQIYQIYLHDTLHIKMKISIKDISSKCEQMRRKLQIWSHLLKKSLM